MFFSKASLLAVLGVATAIQYASASNTRNRDALIPRQTSTTANDYSTEYWFDQLIDHANSTAGTFKQRYFFSDQYYKGQGAPIVIGTPGEQSADGFYSDLTGSSMMNMMMQNWGAAGVVLEHRYWGKSSPCHSLNAPNLQNLTIEDYKYFVETVVLPWAAGAYTTTPTSTPWVDIGSSYSGHLVGSVQQQGISEFRGWLENWYATHPGVTNTLATPGKLVIAARAYPDDTGDEAADDVDDGLDDNTADAAAVDDEDDEDDADDQPDGTDPTADANALDDEDDEGDQPDGSDPTADAAAADDEDDEDDEGDQPDGTDPTADGTDPTADGTDPTADGTDPTADGTDPTADGTDPTANANVNAVDDEDDEVDQPDGTDPTANANANALDDEDDEDDEGDQPDGTDPTADPNALDDEDDEDDEGDQPDGTDPTADANALDDEDDEDDEGDQPDGTDPTADANALDDEDDEDDEGDQPDGSDPNANADVVDDEDDEDDEGDQPDGTDPTADGTDPTADGTDPTADPNDPNAASVDDVDDDPDDDTLNSIATDAGADDAATGQIQTNGNDNNSNNNSELQDKINQLAANKKLTIASFIVNGVLALLVIGCLVLLFLTKRKANKSKSTSSVLPRWIGAKDGKDGVHEGDQLGEYGTGRRAGGRGQYKTLEEQTH